MASVLRELGSPVLKTKPITTAGNLQARSGCTGDYKRSKSNRCCVCQQQQRLQQTLGLSNTKQRMRATLEAILFLLVGYSTLADGASKLLQVTTTN